ncbi:hypothetical protein MUK42_30502 [Musa troglodytarum]|uniref:Uncharacterized protein n=1 Tax=Musa troglodytarum TaxID=320322 RepID=A0A9E7GCE9_9LILI|nr:hypothetical protein MUK42_30502 [Musa troglodytarum]
MQKRRLLLTHSRRPFLSASVWFLVSAAVHESEGQGVGRQAEETRKP